MKRLLIVFLIIIILLAACTPAKPTATATPTLAVTEIPTQTETPTATVSPTPVPDELYVDPGRDLGPISPYIFGSNYSMYGAVPVESLQAALDSHVTAFRWPGGQWGNANDIQTFNLDAFIAFCKQVNALPTISVRYQGGTPEKAAELVRYANIEKGYNITYWSIGNEPDYEMENGKKIDPADFNPRWRAIALAMKAVDPSIKIMGPELSQWGLSLAKTAKYPPVQTPAYSRVDWMTEFLKANGDLVDIVSVHRYPKYAPSSPIPITPARLRENTVEWNQYVNYLRSLIHEITGRDLPVAFTEVNSDPTPGLLGGSATPDSFYNAIWYADVLGRLIQERVFMVNQWVFAYRSGGLGLIFGSELRPTYYVFQMYYHFGSEQVLATSGVQYVTVYAAKRADGTLTILVINLLDTEQRIPLKVEGVDLSKAQVWLFDADHKAVDMGVQSFPADGRLVLPVQSITLYALGN
jgi:hypothetical protein